MSTTLTIKGQVTIPKHVRDAVGLQPGHRVEFAVTDDGQVIIRKAGPAKPVQPDRFDRATGTADIRWRTDELMALLRG
jgi:AbrB family looped-hinge helix DNA binding protein